MRDRVLSRAWWRGILFMLIGLIVGRSKGSQPPLPSKPRRILVLAPVLRGDYIILSPLIAGIAQAYPRAEIGVVVTRASIELAKADPYVNKVIYYQKLPAWPRSVLAVIRYKPDIVVLPKGHPAFTESLLLLLSRAYYKVGLSHPQHDLLLTHPVPHEHENEHRSEAYARLLAPFGLDPATVNRRPHIGRNTRAEKMADKFIRDFGEGKPWISLNVSAGSIARFWPVDYWKNLILCLTESRPQAKFLVLGIPKEQSLCNELSVEFENVYTIPTTSFLDATALLARTKMLISPDTGTVHAAAARDIPVVVLYNSDRINYVRFAPQSVPHRAVFAEKGRDVNTISVQEVYHEAIHLLVEIES